MAHFAKLNNSNVVIQVITVNNAVLINDNGVEDEQKGIEFLKNLYKEKESNWKQTSYNTKLGKYLINNNLEIGPDQSKSFRLNYAAAGMIWREDLQGFIFPQPYNSWSLDETTGVWNPPVPRPGAPYVVWNDNLQRFEDNEGNIPLPQPPQ